MEMQKITKKKFIEELINKRSKFVTSVFRRTDEIILNGLNTSDIEVKLATVNYRTVTETHSNHIVFSNGSSLYFNQQGKKEYFEHTNGNGTRFLVQRTSYHDERSKDTVMDYIVYAICE